MQDHQDNHFLLCLLLPNNNNNRITRTHLPHSHLLISHKLIRRSRLLQLLPVPVLVVPQTQQEQVELVVSSLIKRCWLLLWLLLLVLEEMEILSHPNSNSSKVVPRCMETISLKVQGSIRRMANIHSSMDSLGSKVCPIVVLVLREAGIMDYRKCHSLSSSKAGSSL